MPKYSFGPRLPAATSKVVSAASRGPIARAAAKSLVAGESIDDAIRLTDELTSAAAGTAAESPDGQSRISWRPLLVPPASTDDLLTVQADTIGAVSALAATGAPSPDLTIDVGTFGVFADDVSGGVLINSLREVGQAARNAGVTLTLTVTDPLYIQAVYVLGDELRQDFPETGIVLPTRLRGASDDLSDLATNGRRVRLTTERLDAALGMTSARESGNAFVDITKALLDAQAVTAFDTDDALLLDIAASLVRRHDAQGAEVVTPLGVTAPTHHDDAFARRVVVPYGPMWSTYVASALAGRPSLALTLPNPVRRRR